MSGSQGRPVRWGWLAAVVVLLLVFGLLAFLLRGDARLRQAVALLGPGMTQQEVEEVLRPVDHVRIPASGGEVRYLLYGVDEFVTVILEQDGETARVSRVEHMPDAGPWWERLRRRWEHRFR
jgi:hypothetical protein